MPAVFSLADLRIDPAALKNSYFAVRHEEATSNVEGLLCSSECDDFRHPLTDGGRREICNRAQEFVAAYGAELREKGRIAVYCSPLTRAVESAALFAAVLRESLGIDVSIEIHEGLRERGYGALDRGPVSGWQELRRADQLDLFSAPFGAESAGAMFGRVHAVFVEVERQLTDYAVILVSHCDPIQVMQSLFAPDLPRHYSDVGELSNGSFLKLGAGDQRLL